MTKLNLACGTDYKEGYINVDNCKNIKSDLKHNLNKYPWPFKNNSKKEIIAKHIIEHMDSPEKFLEECYRILEPNGTLHIECPIGGTWSSYHLNHKYNMSPYSFKILEPKNKWSFQFNFKFKIKDIHIFMPIVNNKIPFPWRLIYLNCLINNIFTKMRVRLIKIE